MAVRQKPLGNNGFLRRSRQRINSGLIGGGSTDCERRYRSENRDHEYRRDRAARVWSPCGKACRSRLTVSVGPDPSDVPVVQVVDLITALAGLLHSFALGDLIGRYDWRRRISLSR